MKKFKTYIKTQEPLLEFANIGNEHTNISNIVIHAYSQDDKQLPRGPRIKISNIPNKFRESDCFVINILNGKVVEGEVKITQKELQMVKLWIALNKKELLDYWEVGNEILTIDFYRSLKPLN